MKNSNGAKKPDGNTDAGANESSSQFPKKDKYDPTTFPFPFGTALPEEPHQESLPEINSPRKK